MEQTTLLLVNDLHKNISKIVHNTINILIGMCYIHHEPFEIGVSKTKLEHHLV
jgi:hypothetical protein